MANASQDKRQDTRQDTGRADDQGGLSHMRVDRGEPLIRTAPMPADMNGNGDIFGGWVLSQMDIAGGIVAARRAQGRVATVAVDAMTFHQPIKVGDIVSIYGHIIRVGRSSMAVKLETIVARRLDPTEIKVTEGVYTYVAIDEEGRPRPVPVEASSVRP